jgi:hypothetical protein
MMLAALAACRSRSWEWLDLLVGQVGNLRADCESAQFAHDTMFALTNQILAAFTRVLQHLRLSPGCSGLKWPLWHVTMRLP